MVNPELKQKSSSSSTEATNSNEAGHSHRRQHHHQSPRNYVDNYSHVPETSAFQRDHGQIASPHKATIINKEHNSAHYGRDFTAYDGITARARRQCASVPCRKEVTNKVTTERVQKIRHKLDPVHDYRLMDTVHYLAQGEFASRDDGIKLTPSREAVLSDIIWEDVFRTHWPNVRLTRRGPQERGQRWELLRNIDNLLRERVAHVERRRRRHYKIVKLNQQRHETCRHVGKTGDVIVAKQHDKQGSNCEAGNSAPVPHTRRSHHRHMNSQDRLIQSDTKNVQADDCVAGTSSNRTPQCYCQAAKRCNPVQGQDICNKSSVTSNKNPRYLVKKDSSRRKHHKEEQNMEHYILLPTLVMKTSSNGKRQKTFNILYHRLMHRNTSSSSQMKEKYSKDVGYMYNVNLTDSDDTT